MLKNCCKKNSVKCFPKSKLRFNKNLVKCLKVVGLDLFPDEVKTRRQKIIKFLQWFYFWFFFANLCAIIVSVFISTFDEWNFKSVNKNLPALTNLPYILFKITMTYKHRGDIGMLLKTLDKKLISIHWHQERRIYYKVVCICNRFHAGYKIIEGTMIVIGSVAFLLIHGTKRLAFSAWIPFSYTDWRVFASLHAWIFWTILNVLLISYAMNGLMFAAITIIAKHFDVLKAEVESFGEQSTMDDIMKFIEKHNEALELVEMLRKIYSSTFRFNFVQSLIILCCAVSQLLLSYFSVKHAFFLAPVIFASMQTFMNIYLSRRINDACSGISDGAYNCEWHSFKDNKMRNLILLIMMRSEKAKILKIIDFGEFIYDSFSSVSKYL